MKVCVSERGRLAGWSGRARKEEVLTIVRVGEESAEEREGESSVRRMDEKTGGRA